VVKEPVVFMTMGFAGNMKKRQWQSTAAAEDVALTEVEAVVWVVEEAREQTGTRV
jgi:hypothetical protein